MPTEKHYIDKNILVNRSQSNSVFSQEGNLDLQKYIKQAASEDTGTCQFGDTEYPDDENVLSISSGVITNVPMNAGSIFNFSGPENATNWVNSSGLFLPDSNKASWLVRVSFNIIPDTNNRNLTLTLDIGGSIGIIYDETKRLARGASFDHSVVFPVILYSADTFVSNGGQFKIEADGDVDIYNVLYVVTKTHQSYA